MSTAISTFVNTQAHSTFNDIVESYSTDKFINEFSKDKSEMVNNYVAIRRVKRKLLGHQSAIFLNENSGVPALASLKKAKNRLNAYHWESYFEEVKLFILMTSQRKKEWKAQIKNLDVPDFNVENIRHVTNDVLNSSHKYFAERIVYVMSKLSKNHLTNSRFGFGEKIIIENLHFGSTPKIKYPSLQHDKYEAIDELRKIVAFIKNKDLRMIDTDESLDSYEILNILLHRLVDTRKAEHHLDNNSIHIKMFLKGTIHISIEPEVAEQMNAYVAALFPNQIPSCINRKAYFTKPKGNITLHGKPVHTTIVSGLRSLVKNNLNNFLTSTKGDLRFKNEDFSEFNLETVTNSNAHYMFDSHLEKINESGLFDEFLEIVSLIGGKHFKLRNHNCFIFDYDDLKSVVDEIIISGLVDDKKTYQQYYTNEKLSKIAHNLLIKDTQADQLNTKRYIEPSCGTGNLLKLLPKENTTGVELSKVNSALCTAYGYSVVNDDFITYASSTSDKFDMALMNPPFTQNQAYNHTMATYTLLNDNGRLVAILPSSLRGKFNDLLNENVSIDETDDFSSQFDGTNVTVFILTLQK